MSKVSWKGTVLLAPVPAAIVTCADTDGDGCARVNALTVGWCGVLCSHPPKTYISLRPSRYSYEIIKNSREFVINLTTESLARAADYVGVRSGRDEDKLAEAGLHTEPASAVSAPLLSESPVSLECRVCDILPLGSHDMFLADIVAVDVDESLIDESGRLMLERAGLIAYAHGDYYRLGERIGDFGFSVRRKKTVGYGKRPREKNGARRHDAAAAASSDGDGRASADLGTESSAPPVRRDANTSAVSDSDVNASERSDADAAKRHKSATDRAHSRPAFAKKRTGGSASASARSGSRGPKKRR